MEKLFLVLLLFTSTSIVQAQDDCAYASLPGKEFAFRERTESLQKYGYQEWQKKPEMMSSKNKSLDYASYTGKKGKIQEQQIEDRVSIWYVAVLETCEKVYTSTTKRRPWTIFDLEKYTGIYYIDTLRQAESLVGMTIWVNQNSVPKDHRLITDDPNASYSLGHLEPLDITGATTKLIGHSRGVGPLSLVVKKQNGEGGYIVFNDSYFFRTNPVDSQWDKAVIDLIKQRKIRIGMTEQQVLLSWGSPHSVNKSVGPYGVHGQWVYGAEQYVYMENGKLTSFQTAE